jgi:hypothetical protein
LPAAPNPFVHAVYVAALAFEHRRRDGSHELYLTPVLDVAQALGSDATVSELSTAVLTTSSKTLTGRLTISLKPALTPRSWKRLRHSPGGQRRKMRRSSLGSVRLPETSG